MPLAAALDSVIAPALLDPYRLVRAVAAGRRRGLDRPKWRRVELRPVDLATGRRLQIVRYDDTQAFTANVDYGEQATGEVRELLAMPFGNWHIDAVDATVQLRVTKSGEAAVHTSGPREHHSLTDRAHDRVKPRLLDPADPLLHLLGLTAADGRVKPSRQDKLRQVEEFLRALEAVFDPAMLPADRPVRIVDLGCGNAYLTFAAYRHLSARHALPIELVGVDVKAQARRRNEELAAALDATGSVRFVEGAIATAPVDGADVVLALHACDTATDEALARAIRWRAPLILAAPCCHHDIAAQLRGGAGGAGGGVGGGVDGAAGGAATATAAAPAVPAPFGLVVRHGILRERLADVLTDGIRAAILRLLGYRVDVVEFVPSRHTPRNVLIRAVYTGAPPTAEQERDYRELIDGWNLRPRLAALVGDLLG